MLKQNRIPELMDDPLLDPVLHSAALKDLSRLNSLSGSARILARPILRLAKAQKEPLRVLDVASGAGDLAIALQKYCLRKGHQITVHGLDFSPIAVAQASADNKAAGTSCTFACHDVLKDPLPEGYDVIVTSLFTHHLDAPEVKKLLTEMKNKAAKLVMVNDLLRSNTSLFVVTAATKLFTPSPIVQYDGPVSVKAAYTSEEMRALAHSAGLVDARVDIHWPCRYLLRWHKPAINGDGGKQCSSETPSMTR